MNYSTGKQNIITDQFQMIRLSEGYCPHKCSWCYEHIYAIPKQDYPCPEIIKTDVRISDMNILASYNPIAKINQFHDIKVNGKVVYPHLICGIDYRYLTQEIANTLKYNRFTKIHIAWDKAYGFHQIKDAISMLINAGYKSKSISVFMICNHSEISFDRCMEKFYLCHEMKVKINDCYYDNQYGRKQKIPIGWTLNEIKAFRKLIRKHNQILNFGIDPERNQPHYKYKGNTIRGTDINILDAFFLTSDKYEKKHRYEAKEKIKEFKGGEPTEKEIENYLLS